MTTLTIIKDLAKELLTKSEGGTYRYILGLAGAPAAGKSTVARLLKDMLDELSPGMAVVAPMDGFHRRNDELLKMGLWELKGIPATFDAEAFLAKLEEIQVGTRRVGWPTFDRTIEEPTEDGVFIEPEHKIVIVEGNYLLLDIEPWREVGDYLDEVWYLESDQAVTKERLLARHKAGGKSEAAAVVKVESTDLPNAELIEECKGKADRLLLLPTFS